MPYIISSSVEKGAVGAEFEPQIDGRLKARFTLGLELTAQERDSISRSIVVEPLEVTSMPDVFGWSIGPFFVSPRLKDVLDELEAGVQRFLQVAVRSRRPIAGVSDHGSYFLLESPPRVDAIAVHATDFRSGFGRYGYKEELRLISKSTRIAPSVGLSMAPSAKCVVKAQSISGRHLWRLPDLFGGKYMCSDALHDRMVAANMNGWTFALKCVAK